MHTCNGAYYVAVKQYHIPGGKCRKYRNMQTCHTLI